MTTKLSSLRVTAEMDVAQYVRAAAQKAGADQSMVASAKAVGQSLAALDAAAQKVAPGVTSLSRSWVLGYGEAAKFEAAVRRVGQALDRGMDAGRAAAALDGIYRKFGQTADAVRLATQGYTALAPVISAVNAQHEVAAAVMDREAAAAKRLTDAQRAQAAINAQIGVSSPTSGAARLSAEAFLAGVGGLDGVAAERAKSIAQAFTSSLEQRLVSGTSKSARDSASVFSSELDRIDEVARMKGAQAGQEFQRSLEERLVGGAGKSAREAASVFSAELDRIDEIARMRGAQIGQEFQRALNERLVSGSGKSASASASVFQEYFTETEKQAIAVRRLRAEVDPLSEAIRANSERLETYADALRRGDITQAQFEMGVARSNKVFDDTKRSIDGANVAMGKYRTGSGLARDELINLSRQIQDVGVSLASGQSPMTVLIQQGTQIADVFATSRGSITDFFRQAGAWAGRFLVSTTGIVTAMTALGAAAAYVALEYSASQRAIEVSLMGVGRGSGQTVDSINKIAEAAANASRISAGSAREIAAAFASTGQIDRSLISTNLIDTMSRGFGVLTGTGQTEAAKELAQALASPTAGAAELEKRLGKLSDAQMEFIRSAEAAGNKLEAQRALLSAINEPLSMAATRVGLFAQAWEAVSKAAGAAADAIGRVASGPSLDERIAGLQKLIEQRTTFGYRQSSIREAEAQLAPLLRERRLRNEAAEFARNEASANSLSRNAGGIARGIVTDAGRRMDLENQLSVLEKAFGDQSVMRKLGPTADLVRESIERLRGSLANFETAAERIQRDYELQIQQTNAYTLAEKAAVEAERARIEAIRAGRGEVQAGVEAEQARTRAVTEANRQLRDTARDLSDAGSLIGLSPFQRSLREAANASRRERDTLTTGVTATGPLSRDQILDMIAKYESGNRNIHQNIVPPGGGYNPSVGRVTGPSSAQGYFQITNPTWRDGAKLSGVDLKQYPNAMSAPYDVQRKVAGALLDSRGASPWAPYNPSLRNALGGQGGAAANDNASARVSNAVREAYEGWNTPLANSERQLTAQIALMEKQQASFFKSTSEIERAAEKQRLLNEYQQQGIPITSELAAGIDAYAQRAGAAAQQAAAFSDVQKAFTELDGLPKDALKGIISDLRAGKTGAEVLTNALNRVGDKLIDISLNMLFSKNTGGGIFSSLFGLGGSGSLFGGAEKFASNGLPLFGPGFSAGGWTGAGGKNDPAGVVHRGEFVFDQAATKRIGVDVLEQMRRGGAGYADGGAVGPMMPTRRRPMASARGFDAPNASTPRAAGAAMSFNYTIDARGAEAGAVARIERVMAQQQADLGRQIDAADRRRSVRGVRA